MSDEADKVRAKSLWWGNTGDAISFTPPTQREAVVTARELAAGHVEITIIGSLSAAIVVLRPDLRQAVIDLPALRDAR